MSKESTVSVNKSANFCPEVCIRPDRDAVSKATRVFRSQTRELPSTVCTILVRADAIIVAASSQQCCTFAGFVPAYPPRDGTAAASRFEQENFVTILFQRGCYLQFLPTNAKPQFFCFAHFASAFCDFAGSVHWYC